MSVTTITKMSRVRRPQYRLTQRRLQIKLGEANDLIDRLLQRGHIPDMTLHPVAARGAIARYVGCHRFRRAHHRQGARR